MERNRNIEDMKKLRDEIQKKWRESGLLDGLKGKEIKNIDIFQCCKTSKI